MLRKLLYGDQAELPDAREARQLAQRISERADRLNEHLQSYQRNRDPFAAMMSDLYNRDQLSRLHRGTET